VPVGDWCRIIQPDLDWVTGDENRRRWARHTKQTHMHTHAHLRLANLSLNDVPVTLVGGTGIVELARKVMEGKSATLVVCGCHRSRQDLKNADTESQESHRKEPNQHACPVRPAACHDTCPDG
jgi:hypothetical protein